MTRTLKNLPSANSKVMRPWIYFHTSDCWEKLFVKRFHLWSMKLEVKLCSLKGFCVKLYEYYSFWYDWFKEYFLVTECAFWLHGMVSSYHTGLNEAVFVYWVFRPVIILPTCHIKSHCCSRTLLDCIVKSFNKNTEKEWTLIKIIWKWKIYFEKGW